jgi:hypothetical protein
MANLSDLAYELSRELVGPQSVVPWWAWLAFFVMVFGGLLGLGHEAD